MARQEENADSRPTKGTTSLAKRGFLTVALGNLDWLEFAVDLSLSVKDIHGKGLTVVTDARGCAYANQRYSGVFDHILTVPSDFPIGTQMNKMVKFLIPAMSPYEQGIVLDCDMICLSSLDGLWKVSGQNAVAALCGSFKKGEAEGILHHGHSVEKLMAAFGRHTYEKCALGSFWFDRALAIDLFDRCVTFLDSPSAKLHRPLLMNKNTVSDEIVLALVARTEEIGSLPGGTPFFYYHEAIDVGPGELVRPLFHCDPYPKPTARLVFGEASQRRRHNGLPGTTLRHWKRRYLSKYYGAHGKPLWMRVINNLLRKAPEIAIF